MRLNRYPSGGEASMYASSPVVSGAPDSSSASSSGVSSSASSSGRPRSHKKNRPPPLHLHPQYESCQDILGRRRFSSGGSCGDCGAVDSAGCTDASSSTGASSTSSGSDTDYCSAAQLQRAGTVTVATTEPVLAAPLDLEDPDADALSSLPVSENERQQVDSFFRGLKTQVFVCGSLTNLYLGSTAPGQEGAWELRYTGIPVVLLDTGEARARNKRRIQILLAERGSCFTLWQDTIDNLSSYREAGPAFHTMCLSSDHSTLVGLSFDCPQAAQQLWDHVERLTSCPENISLSGPGARGRGRKSPRKSPKVKPVPLPSKAHISQPCCFQHVTSVDRKDRDRYFSLQTLVPALAEIEQKAVPNVS
ncbi:hypothetical protein ONE63_004947 [Megalurothrips usitatus]|uniref:Uncharacterized protein n=1 Tax=Megalurothrips usitatus TaxID=439358 RepID=A0AAV7X1B8_9NEOP|nr:hypothetical protein ONE63_004947 [Megalurothrips usitatus]